MRCSAVKDYTCTFKVNLLIKYLMTYQKQQNQTMMGHIDHLRKQYKSINTYD